MGGAESRSRRKKSSASKTEKSPVRGKSDGRPAKAPEVSASPDERHQMIALAAYYRAEQRGFANGDPLQDWLEAEAQVMMRLESTT
jgi:hypothetical protein